VKILIAKHCNNIRFGDYKEYNGGNTEPLIIMKLLQKMGHQCSVVTIPGNFDGAPEGTGLLNWQDPDLIKKAEENDCLIMFCGVFNCFGGVIGPSALASYKLLKAKMPIIYAVMDLNIPIGDCAGWIRNAQSKGKYHDLNADDYEVDASKIYCVSQAYKPEVHKKLWKTKENAFGGYEHVPFESSIIYRRGLITQISPTTHADLLYFGNPRGGKRDKKFIKFYCNQNYIHTVAYGNWKDKQIDDLIKKGAQYMPSFMGKCDSHALHEKINQSIAHCYISDPAYEGTTLTNRFYEATLNRCVLFVDVDNDPERFLFLDKYFYVADGKELAEKVLHLKKDPSFRTIKLNQQMVEVGSRVRHALQNYPITIENRIKEAIQLYGKNLRDREQ
jgi:hypothetical protein